MMTQTIPGYTYGDAEVAASPLDLDDLQRLQATVLWSEEDEQYLRLAGDVLEDQVDDVLDLWYGFVGSHPHLLHYFEDEDGSAISRYLKRVRERFAQWILDTCRRSYDQTWLDYQMEIALRHTRALKNKTDDARAATQHIPLRYMIAFIYPITATIKGFLANKGHAADEVERMHQAWFKSVTLQITIWSYPYAKDGDF